MATEFEQLKKKHDEIKAKIERCRGQLESIEQDWMKRYGTSNFNDVLKILNDRQQELAEMRQEFSTLFDQASKILDECSTIG